MSNISFSKIVRLWDNLENIKAEEATDDNMAHAHFMRGTQGYKNTIGICNNYSFSTVTMIARAPLIITLNIHCLSCPCLETKVWQNCKKAELGYRQCAHKESECLSLTASFCVWDSLLWFTLISSYCTSLLWELTQSLTSNHRVHGSNPLCPLHIKLDHNCFLLHLTQFVIYLPFYHFMLYKVI